MSRKHFWKKQSKTFKKTKGICRDCQRSQPVQYNDWFHTSSPKCIECGGMLDRKGSWTGSVKAAMQSSLTGSHIIYGETPSEFEIQSYVYQQLKELKYNVRCCVTTTVKTDVFDIVIFDGNNTPLYILEIKKRNNPKLNSKQLERYAKYGIPVELIGGMNNAIDFIDKIITGEIKIIDIPKSPELEDMDNHLNYIVS